jgi:hypothetical protein
MGFEKVPLIFFGLSGSGRNFTATSVTVLMDSHKRSTQLERLEVVETGRRRRWSDDEKLRIVTESFEAPRAISSTARRHGISRS